MTITKWKKPLLTGPTNVSPVVFESPLSGLFNNFLVRGDSFGGDDFFTREFASFVPAVNFSEEKEHYLLEFSTPGFEKNDFKIELNKGVLTVSAEHKTENETSTKKYTRKEFNYGAFNRSFTLPEEINENAVEAKYENGILKVYLPKQEQTKKEALEIKIS